MKKFNWHLIDFNSKETEISNYDETINDEESEISNFKFLKVIKKFLSLEKKV